MVAARRNVPEALLRFIMASQSCICLLSSRLFFGGRYFGRVLLITLSRALGPIDFATRCREPTDAVDAFDCADTMDAFDCAVSGVVGGGEDAEVGSGNDGEEMLICRVC